MPAIAQLETVSSPALLFDVDAIEKNLALMIRIAGGDPSLLRPHIKTHKCREILERQLALGIRQVKCATLAETELAAQAGVPDILVAYPLVGPNVDRLFELVEAYPDSRFAALVDSEAGLAGFLRPGRAPFDLFIDLDCGMHRTGVAPGDRTVALARAILPHPEVRLAGLHAYDGHIHDGPLQARTEQFDAAMTLVDETLEKLEAAGIPVPLVVSGGSPTFALHASRCTAGTRPWQCSPGTTVLWDYGYGDLYPDLPFEPAALLLARVVSHPGSGESGPQRICLDLGHKSVASENPLPHRVRFPDLPGAEFLSQSEEHLVLGVEKASDWPVGTVLVGIPKHVCPTIALHQEARLVRGGAVTGEAWPIAARDRRISH